MELLDLNARRWTYTIKYDEQVKVSHSYDRGGGVSMATDGGLVCQILDGGRDEGALVFVRNPVAKTSERLPPSPYPHLMTRFAVINMTVDNRTNNYKVFLMANFMDAQPISAVSPLMALYESTTNKWRPSSTIGLLMPLNIGGHNHAVCSVFSDGLLYVLMYTRTLAKYCIWSYNDVEDAWMNTGVNIDAGSPEIRSLS